MTEQPDNFIPNLLIYLAIFWIFGFEGTVVAGFVDAVTQLEKIALNTEVLER